MKWFDAHIFDLLFSDRTRGDFGDFIDRTLGYGWDGSPLMRAGLMREWYEREQHFITEKDGNTILEMEMNLIPVLARMEEHGIMVDREKLRDIGSRLSRDITRIEEEVYDLIGERINLSSPKQIVELFERLQIPLLKKNKTGFSVDTEVLEGLAGKYDIARLIIEHRTYSKLRSTYIDALMKSIDPKTGRIHTHYNQIGASTGRMSSEDPNLQNIPTGGGYADEIKSCFIAPPSKSLMVADYSQIELRVLAFLSGDEALSETFRRDEDIHARTAHFLFGEDTIVTQEMRRIAKTVNFGVIYGITGFGLSKSLGTTPGEATQYIHDFFLEYPSVKVYYDTILEKARENGFVETYFGRRRSIKAIHDANRIIRTGAEREAINMPVQGMAADMLKLAMIQIDTGLRQEGLRSHMLLQIHDELVFEIAEGESERVRELVRTMMEGVLPESSIPIRVDIHSGSNWAEAKK